jgi:hypothetical protein
MPLDTNTLVNLTDKIAADLESLPLPDHLVWKYVKPIGLRTDLGNWLCVYPDNIAHTLETTTTGYDDEVLFHAEWHCPTPSVAQSNIGAQDVAKANLQFVELILARVRSYGAGIPASLSNHAVLVATEMSIVTDMTWRFRASFNVEVWW